MSDIPAIAAFTRENNPAVHVFDSGYTLSNLHKILPVARENHFGVVAVNQRHKLIIEASCEAAWQQRSPIILECAESEVSYCDMAPERMAPLVYDVIAAMIKKYGYTVPVVMHQDHVQKDLTLIDRAAKAGFSSCEVDLSRLAMEENIQASSQVVRNMHPLGISVEVEEGEIGFASALKDMQNVENYYTKVEDAYKLVEATRPDAVAVFVGNGHGQYEVKPRIGFERIREIDEAVREFGVQVVLHGGSGLPAEEFRKAVAAGAAKFNYATSVSDILFKHFPAPLVAEMEEAGKAQKLPFRKVLKQFLGKIDALDVAILNKAKQGMIDHISLMMINGFQSNGKASLYN